ncbi:RHS repeat-associated core domain-containing protein [Streptomyces qinglanensis]|uniref:RHS repeat-associated core domain-containing protein n=1 Tax=Streptomyces qinglanensis TaxID=943816 RepID=A0A1H9NT69_9ACTN|nr:RHS repeat-associated core domain-containing protein [Streptomyces qinglanensis]SER38543.1 RHS repeat-associated core domain-containing protein [Streptomyces qinglanensis]
MWTYAYDPLGRRISKRSPKDETTIFSWDGTCLAEQTTANGRSTTWDYTLGTYRPLTQTDHTQLVPEPGTSLLTKLTELTATRPEFHAIVTDLTGTPTELITSEGALVWQNRTTLWGTPLPSPDGHGDTTCPLRFPGQYADPESGLHYNYFRYYDPETAHYLTPDPLGLAPAPNDQTYVLNPLSLFDPLGQASCPAAVRKDFDSMPDGRQPGKVKVVSGVKELRAKFDAWTDGATPLPPRGPKIPEVYQLEDGTVIQWRTSSQSGGETIDITEPGKIQKKVHIDNGN